MIKSMINISTCKTPQYVEYSVEKGVMRWTSNGQVPPKDVVTRAIQSTTLDIWTASCDKAREEDTRKAFADYTSAMGQRTPEEVSDARMMARAVHGPGVRLMDIITGESYTT